jgi:ABC-type transport system involved in multi-copper enzyme maturation permease subunit
MRHLTQFWLRRYLKQGRLAVVYALVLTVAILNGLYYSDLYKKDLQQDRKLDQSYIETLGKVKDFNPILFADAVKFKLNMPTSPLKFLADNQMQNVPTSRSVGPLDSGPLTSQKSLSYFRSVGTGKEGFSGGPAADMTFLVTVVLSFFSFVLTYDAACGQKQGGTLKQLLANSVPRHYVYLSSVLAALITLALPFLLGMLVNLLILNLNGVLPLDVEYLLVLGLFFVLGLLLLALFTALGVTISALTKSPVTSLVFLLLVWILLVQVIPGTALLSGKALAKVDSFDQYSAEERSLWEGSIKSLERRDAAVRPVEAARAYGFRTERVHNEVFSGYLADRRRLTEERSRDLFNQSELVRGLSRFSPVMVFRLAVSRLAGTDLPAVKDFYRQTERYREALFDFLTEADARDPDSAHLIYVMRPGYLSAKPIGEEPPRFAYSQQDLAVRAGDSLLDILILFSMTACVLLIGVFAFNRYDPR